MTNTQNELRQQVESKLERIEHLHAHLASDVATDYCERELLADGARGNFVQTSMGIDWMRETYPATLEDWEADLGPLTEDNADDWADALESMTEDEDVRLIWDAGDLFTYGSCEMARALDEGVMDDELYLSVENEGEHIRGTMAWGGPGVYIMRDWDGDRLAGYWWGEEPVIIRCGIVTAELDRLSEYFEQ